MGWDVATFWAHYPLSISWGRAALYHLTTQNLASALAVGRPEAPVVITVHDIIPWLLRDDPNLRLYGHALHRLLDGLAARGLARADALIAVSHWTKQTLVDKLGIPAGRVRVIHEAANPTVFMPRATSPEFRQRFGLEPGWRHLLYVGSEEPRKNLAVLLYALAGIRTREPRLRLLKVGQPYHDREHARLQDLSRTLGLEDQIHWLGPVTEMDLAQLYAVADLFVFPSLYEGFGLPVLEALASGTRVVCAATSALSEVAGADSIMCAPTVEGLSEAIMRALDETPSPEATAERVAWARGFSWEETARQTIEVYTSLLGTPRTGSER